MLNRNEKMKIIYEEAVKMLDEIKPDNVDMNKYFNINKNFENMKDVLYVLLISLQDRQALPNIIGLLKEERKETFKKILFDYDAEQILEHYNEDSLLTAFSENFVIKNIESKSNSWRLYAKSVISASKFLCRFNSVEDFESFIDRYSEYSIINLPIFLKENVFGMGFALACNFLKDLGYSEYIKPDVHIKDIFVGSGLCLDDDYSIFNTAIEMSNHVGVSAAHLDKLLWIVCSGNFHLDGIKVGNRKSEFISRIKNILKL